MVLMFLKRSCAALAAIVLPLVPALAGCGSEHASDGRAQVVASMYPLQWLTQQVGGDRVDVTDLVAPGQEPHDVDLTPRQVAQVGRAALVVYERGMATSVDNAITAAPARRSLDVSTTVTMQRLGTAAEDGESASSLDPHVWLDPTNMQRMAAAIADLLEGVDPAHAGDYRDNLKALDQTLGGLDRQYRSGLASCQRTQFVTSHAAFGYLARRYHLVQIPVSGISPDEEPAPSRIAAVQRLARQYHVTTIFTETLASPALARSIAGDLHLATAVLDPVEGITGDSAGTDYPSVMRSNLTALRTANGCR